MDDYLVEIYLPDAGEKAAARVSAAARRSTARLAREGRGVRYIRSIFVPEDETYFLLLEAASAEDARDAAAAAGLACDRVTRAIPDAGPGQASGSSA